LLFVCCLLAKNLDLYNTVCNFCPVVMTASINVDSEALGAVHQVFPNLLAFIFNALHGVWIEGLVVAVALHLYLASSRRCSVSGKQAERPPKCILEKREGCSITCKQKSQSKSEHAEKVRSLVVSLLGQGSACQPETLELYEDLVRAKHVDLRRHVSDEKNARSMYVALISCAAALATATPTPANAETSPPCPQRWISKILVDMRMFGFPRTVEFYANVQKALVQNRLFQDALWLYDTMIEDNTAPNTSMCICFTNVAIECDDNSKALFFLAELSKLGPPSLRTYMTMLRVHARDKDWRKAVELLDLIEAGGLRPDNLILNNVLGLCVDAGQVTKAESLLHHYEDLVDVVSCNILLKGYAQCADFLKSEEVLNRMCRKGPAPNLITFNTVMDCAVRVLHMLISNAKRSGEPRATKPNSQDVNEDSSDHSCFTAGNYLVCHTSSPSFKLMVRRPWELLDRLLELGLEPDRYTCSTLVKGMHVAGCSVSDIDRAVELLYRIGREALQLHTPSTDGSSQSCNFRLLEVIFNTLLDACITARDLDRMATIFQMMQDFRVSISSVTFGTLIKAFGQAGRLSRCREVWAEMQEANVHPTIVTYGCYIDACIRNDEVAAAEEMFRSMSANGARPNAVIYSSLIRGFANSRQPGKALELYRQMREEGIEATSVTFNSVLDVVSRQLSEPEMLHEVLHDMQKASISQDVVTYAILIKASCNAGDVQKALALFRQSSSHGLVFDQVSFNTLLLACSKAGLVADAEEIFEEMRRVDLMPTHVTTSIMIKMYGKAKMLDKAISLSELMEHDYGQVPNLFIYTCLIQACAQNKHVRRSWDIFNKMLHSGIEPDAVTYGTVIHGCVYMNKFDYAMVLVRHAYMKPSPEGAAVDTPFATGAISAKKPVPLQHDVLQMLLSALKRKEQAAFIVELEVIMNENGVAETVSKTKRSRGTGS